MSGSYYMTYFDVTLKEYGSVVTTDPIETIYYWNKQCMQLFDNTCGPYVIITCIEKNNDIGNQYLDVSE